MVSTTTSLLVSRTERVSLPAFATYRKPPPELAAMPLGCRPTVTVLSCFQPSLSQPRTDTEPWLATPVRGSVRTAVFEVTPCVSPGCGGSPAQLVTYALSVFRKCTANGATPTASTCFTWPSAPRRCMQLPRVEAAHNSPLCQARPAGWAEPPTWGFARSAGRPQR